MHSNFLRKQHIHGVLAGAAIGDALGYPRKNASRATALRVYGEPKLKFNRFAGGGLYSSDTHLMFMTGQALLNSRADKRNFRRSFRSRLSWYPLSLPLCAPSTLFSSARSWLARVGMPSGVYADNNSAGATAIFSTLAMHGTGHRLDKWVEETTKLTLTHPLAIDGCRIVGQMADKAALAKGEPLNPLELINLAASVSSQEIYRSKILALADHLPADHTPEQVADQFGWQHRIGSSMLPTTVMSLYCWLRAPGDFETAVLSAIRLGGDSSSMGATVGGLVGAYTGFEGIPQQLYRDLGGTPHGPQWIAELAERFSHWPHGEHDLHLAPAQSSDPPMQVVRNLFAAIRVGGNRLMRLPRGLL